MKKIKLQKDREELIEEFFEFSCDKESCVINDPEKPVFLHQYLYSHFNGAIDGVKLDDTVMQDNWRLLDDDNFIIDTDKDTITCVFDVYNDTDDGELEEKSWEVVLEFEMYVPGDEYLDFLCEYDSIWGVLDTDYVLKIVNVSLKNENENENTSLKESNMGNNNFVPSFSKFVEDKKLNKR